MNSKQPTICLSSYSPIDVLFYTIVIFLTFVTIPLSSGGGNETDHLALLNIKSMITQDPYGALSSWNSSLHFCDWSGVRCGKRHKRVVSVVLRFKGLEGSLSPHVGNLSFLHVLSLFNNSLQGAIPPELGYLSRLQSLGLGRNKFSGVIPANISRWSKLEILDLSKNELVGSIPKDVSSLSKLTILYLNSNKLTGGFPPFLGNLTSIEELYLTENPLGGGIPNTLGHYKCIRIFEFALGNLFGIIPYSLYNNSCLYDLSLAQNHLTGSLPSAIGVMLPNLVGLYLMDNELSGPLPPSISNCSKLEDLQMIKNKFSGKLTIDFARLRYIYDIRLGQNLFGSKDDDEMKFVDNLKNCTTLQHLDLGKCNFQGEIPVSIGNFSNQLQYLYLELNKLHGTLPRSIGNLVGMKLLSLGGNQFTGDIPSTIGNLQNLEICELRVNQLSGPIPYVIGNLSKLIYLELSFNRLEGLIPSSLGKCQRLLELHLNNNKLNGSIPAQLLQLSSLSKMLDLSQNNLFGSLPSEVGALNMLNYLDLSGNKLSGNIPSSLGGCVSLEGLSLKGNLFQGMIPPSLSSMKGLLALDISHNNLSGQIPPSLSSMRGLLDLDISHNNLSGQIPHFLEMLRYVNLSYNDFEGEVPMLGVFANVSAFSILGNNRLCGGLLELKLPKCKETNEHNKKLLLIVIISLTVFAAFIVLCLLYAWCKKKNKMQPSQSSMRKQFLKVSYTQLLKATNGFSEANLIGKGGFSSVYKGILGEGDETFVAVKVLHLQNRGAQSSFTRECEAWQNIRHRNLLKIITSCSSIDSQGNDFKALVYEFMPNGNLHDWLHSGENTSRLSILQMINILMDVASALDYIHNQCIPAVIHGDLKPSNILLDDDMVAHVGDFGLARVLGTSYLNSTTGIRGTIGYAAPEYGLGHEMTSSGDIYSFGILILEAVTGKRPTDEIFNEDLTFHKFASMALRDHAMGCIDVKLLNACQEDEIFMQNKEENVKKIEECLALIVKIGVLCTVDSPLERMDIKKVVQELQHILDTL